MNVDGVKIKPLLADISIETVALALTRRVNLFHDVFNFVLFTVQDDASLLTDLQVLKTDRLTLHSACFAGTQGEVLFNLILRCKEVSNSGVWLWEDSGVVSASSICTLTLGPPVPKSACPIFFFPLPMVSSFRSRQSLCYLLKKNDFMTPIMSSRCRVKMAESLSGA